MGWSSKYGKLTTSFFGSKSVPEKLASIKYKEKTHDLKISEARDTFSSNPSFLSTHPKTKMTMEKQPWMKMYLLLKKWVTFHWHVSFRGGIWGVYTLTPDLKSNHYPRTVNERAPLTQENHRKPKARDTWHESWVILILVGEASAIFSNGFIKSP